MTLRHVAPAIARWGIIPAVAGFVALGSFLLSLPFRSENREDIWLVVIAFGALAVFCFYVAYRGLVLVKFRNVRAKLGERDLLVSHNGHQAYHAINRLEVLDFSNIQIVEVRKKKTGEKLLAVDYYYPFGMELVRRLEQRIGEQAEDDNTSQRPC